MQPRSRSHQDNRHQGAFHTHKNPYQQQSLRQEPFLSRSPLPYPPLISGPSSVPFHHSLPMAESLQFTQMVKNKTAIDDLRALAASNQEEGRNWNVPIHPKHQQLNAESFLYEDQQEGPQRVMEMSESEVDVGQTVQYYKCQMEVLKQNLEQQLSKNVESTLGMRRLEKRNQELEYEIGILLRKLHVSHSQDAHSQRIKELEQQLKQQLVINLELEELLLKRKMKDEARPHPVTEQKESSLLKELRVELVELKNKHRREVDALVNAISQKNQEISRMKESLKLAEVKQEYYPFTFHKIQSPKVTPINPPPLLDAQSDKNPLHFTSTNPSLQGAEARKKTDSFSSKDNKCLCLDNISLRSNANRAGCKTDRR